MLAFSFLNSSQPLYELDLFGSDRIDEEAVQKKFGKKIDIWTDRWIQQSYNPTDLTLLDFQKELEEEIRGTYGFAFVQLNGIHYFTDQIQKDFVVIDVVEEKDKAKRMPFIPAPKGSYPDPEGVFALWDEYMTIGMELLNLGLLTEEDMNDTTLSFHALFGHRHPKLAPYQKISTLVQKHQKEIETIFLDSADENKRANAAFLLSYLKDGQYIINLLQKRLKDSGPEVRNNVMRVYVFIAIKHPELELPLNDLVLALNYPSFGDRNKAVSTLYMMAVHHPEQLERHRSIFMRAVPLLIKLLTQKQPNVRDPAYFLLKALSGKDFTQDNIQEWQKWYLFKKEIQDD